MNFNLWKIFNKSYVGRVLDCDNKPVKDVLVTDGRNVVKTDENGNFKLKGFIRGNFIYITVPDGYECDKFYLPITKGTKSYEFKLEKSEVTAQKNHSFIHITDTEISKNENTHWIETLKDGVKKYKTAFLVHTGDICYEDGLKNHIKIMNTSNMGCTVRYVIGNHDFVDGRYGEELYESIYGPTWYSFDVGNVHYVATPIMKGVDKTSGYMINDCWKWLNNDLKNIDSSKKVIIFNHTKNEKNGYVYLYGKNKLDLKKHNLIGWFYGHYHDNNLYMTDGVLNVSAPRPNAGGIDSSVAGYRVVNVSENGEISTQMEYYDLNKSSQPQNAKWQAKLHANALFCDTVMDNDSLYIATTCDDYPCDCGVHCVDLNGNIKWYYKTKNSIKNNIVIDGDKIIAMDSEGRVYCIDKNNGLLIWEKQVELKSSLVGTSNAICLNGDTVIVGASLTITALKIKDGSVKWTHEFSMGETSPASFVMAKDKILVSIHWDSLSCLDAKSGKKLWRIVDPKIRFRSSTPTIIDDNFALVTGDNAVMTVDLNKGKIVSKTCLDDFSFSSSGVAKISNNIAYIPTSNQGLIAFDIDSNKVLWNFKTDENILFSAPYTTVGDRTVEGSVEVENDEIVFGANDGYLYRLDLNGNLIYKYNCGSAVLGGIKVDSDRCNIYVSTFDGYLLCFAMND